MDIELLRKIVDKNFNDLEINQYISPNYSVPSIAKKHIENLENCSCETPTPLKINFFYKDTKVGGINGQTILTNKQSGMLIARDKIKTEKYLIENNIKTTRSEVFNIDQFHLAKEKVKNSNVPVVVKPFNLSSGKGVTLDVTTSDFQNAWTKAIEAYDNNTKSAKIILQNQIPGVEARLLVIEEKFNSAILRVPTNVIGDGQTSVKGLIRQKNLKRGRHPHLNKSLIKINNELLESLKAQNMGVDSIPVKEEVIFFHKVSNIALGGDTLEISHLISNKLKELAESSVKSIPGLRSAGVDIMFSSFNDEKATVLEINHAGNLLMHHYPWKGEPKQPVCDLIDFLVNDFDSPSNK